jgi:hypothetical protein
MMADPPSEWHKVTSITTTDYLDAMPTPGAGFGVKAVSKQSTPTISSAGVNGTPLPELAFSAPSTPLAQCHV